MSSPTARLRVFWVFAPATTISCHALFAQIIGNPILPAIHGGMTGAFLETTAIFGVTRELGVSAMPKPIGLTINYLRSGRALDSHAKVSIVKQGRRIVAFEAQAWQDDATKPIASAFGHFMLSRTPGIDEE